MAKNKSLTTSELIQEYYLLDSLKQRILQVAALNCNISTAHYLYGQELHMPFSSLVVSLLDGLAADNNGKKLNQNELILNLKLLNNKGFLNDRYRLKVEFLYFLSTIAANKDNIKVNLEIISKVNNFNLIPVFDSYRKFDFNDIQSVDLDDLRALNLAIHTNNINIFAKPWDEEEQQKILSGYRFLFSAVEINEEWLASRLPIFQKILCVIKLSHDLGYPVVENLQRGKWLDVMANCPIPNEIATFPLLYAHLHQLNFINGSRRLIDIEDDNNVWAKNLLEASDNLIAGNNKVALKLFDLSIREFSKITNRDRWFAVSDLTILYSICLLRENKTDKFLSSVIKRLEKLPNLHKLAQPLYGIYKVINNDFNQAKSCFNLSAKYFTQESITPQAILAYAIYLWLGMIVGKSQIDWDVSRHYLLLSDKLNLPLVKTIIAEILLTQGNKYTDAEKIWETSPYKSLTVLNLLHVKEQWEYTIDKLADLLKSGETAQKIKSLNDRRLVWLLDMEEQEAEILEQSLRRNGQWTSGKAVSPTRLYKKTDLEYMEFCDTQATFALEENPYHRGHYQWDFGNLVLKLIGHPRLFDLNNPEIQLELIAETPALIVKSHKNGYHIKLSNFTTQEKVVTTKVSATKYIVYDFTEQLVQLSGLLGKDGIVLPGNAKDRLLEIICKTNPNLKIDADIIDKNIKSADANSECLVQLTPGSNGLILNALVTPFNNGSYYFPGQGLANQIVNADGGGHLKLVRNFKAEMETVTQLVDNCPLLCVGKNSDFEWGYDDLEQSLQLLAELHDYRQKFGLTIEWPKGETLKFAANVGAENMRVRVKSQQQWFEYDGEVTLDNNEVLSLKTLLSLLDSNNSSRFIKLDDGKFIALSENLKRQLNELKLASDGNKVFNLGSSALHNLVLEVDDVKVDKKWQEHLSNLHTRKQFIPQIPPTLQAELRDYQVDGFNYLSRLTNWGIGACLADDMGLGKTVQAIALILEHAANGATLIVAPTSVCFNWMSELNKFAPTLNCYLMHEANERAQLIESLSAMDVLVCSYNLLQQEGSGILAKEWNLVILDEAQAIKNNTTKRFKAACEINAGKRVILSGTPIENHLGELWSLFRFLNPGLLGSLDKFQKKFINPITNKNQIVKQALKNLVQPYILRRTKTQVLSELPPKIEQSIYIEPSSEEMAFYEAIRERALENIAKLRDTDNNHFSILAEITRLRQACCHSTLVDESIRLENSKLTAFLELVNELIEGKHKVLVFSQYVRYLEIVKGVLNDNKIGYQYIDGATPIAQRKTAVTEFQSGTGGDVFLISLKAGGSGLNLTAADYVIILDPWWNPAVEDQAADRAHRMGQERPVTVYRLIMKNTIEEKIIHLHKDKRDLAGDLLDGQNVGGKLSEEDLLNLMRL